SIFVTIGFAFMPGHVAEAFSDKKQPAKQAHDAFAQFQAKRATTIKAGHDAAKGSAAFLKLDAEERATLRDAPAAKPKLKPFNPPKLVPNLQYRCDQAHMLIPSVHTPGPIASFESERDMREQCRPFAVDPTDADKVCTNPELLHCGIGDENNREFCCPKTHPIFNVCDKQCYRNTDFNNALEDKDEGFHCGTSRDCGATIKP
ncbi:MAG TPA: hypothetical protein VMZ53_14650, partial [Kofleriaceae bacterium]|nr:hypothetical protein [Kofleriaceae bacterium]